MIIGLVLCALVAALLFFGIAEKVFKSFGVPYWLAFIIVGVLIGCAFIPAFEFDYVVINVAGFFAPLTFAVVFFAIAVRVREGVRGATVAAVVGALFVSIRLIISPLASDGVTVTVLGLLCGAVAYLTAKSKIAAMSGIFSSIPLAETASSAVALYAYGTPVSIGSPLAFDAVILSAVIAIVLFEGIAAIKKVRVKRRGEAETAEEFDPNEYKKYFDE